MDLKKYFNSALPDNVHATVKDLWFNSIVDRYSGLNRRCHNLNDLNNCLQHFESVKTFVKNPNAIVLALIFRYFEYDPRLADCSEININNFKKFIDESKLSTDSTLCDDVIALLKVASTNSTDEHKTEGCYGFDDKHYFLDIDMVILGMGPSDYDKYTNYVREEYDFIDDKTYKELRVKVLESFLQIPNIYATKIFRDKYELIARNNIQREINSHKSTTESN
ncbi:uncharacterized protein LOC126835543 isoform X2 [Adelges cooleyi]|uniref:uncharacterized protein LOC126835543 isoform X2 n=1 Tax=Adelges cooleyi TaxID=133065 RepID=UPI0021804C00|nr:uncharacterized protein LOC126835543 isoform X2 [Adelges cooleyi]